MQRLDRMYTFISKLPPEEYATIIRNTAIKKGVSSAIVEKDLWVCIVLNYLFSESPWKDKLVFKGGTSLSKAYNLIERFSEDIDLILDWRILGYSKRGPLLERSKSSQRRLNNEIISKTRQFLSREFMPTIKKALRKKIKSDIAFELEDDVVKINYGQNYSSPAILRSIRLEIGALAAWTPATISEIAPYIADIYPRQFGSCRFFVPTTTAERTFWEKATILHSEAYRPAEFDIPQRLSRHYYDIYKMSQTSVMDNAISQADLLEKVANFKAKFYSQARAHYELAKIGSLKLVPPASSIPALEQDYTNMAEMIYGERPTFQELINEIVKIEQKINHLS